MGDRNYLHPEGKHIFSGAALGLCGFLGTVQIAFIALFAKYGFGYHYVFFCIILIQTYMYRKVFINLKNKESPINYYSLVEGYLFISGCLYGIPLVITALLSVFSADRSMSDAFIYNNQALLAWLAHFRLTSTPVQLDLSQLKNALHSYYLALSALSGVTMFILSVPFIWWMTRGWSDFFDANPKQFYALRKIGCALLAAAACVWMIYTSYTDWLHGFILNADGSPRFTSWQYQIAKWVMVGVFLPIMLSAFAGTLANITKSTRSRYTRRD